MLKRSRCQADVTDQRKNEVRPATLALALEPRFMFDAAGMATGGDAVQQQDAQDGGGAGADALTTAAADDFAMYSESQALIESSTALAGQQAPEEEIDNGPEPTPAAPGAEPEDNGTDTAAAALAEPAYQVLREADPMQNGGRREVVFIESNVADYQTLVDGVGPGVEVVLLDGTQDGLSQIAEWAEGKSGYDAVHVLSHGAEGQVHLGTLTLDTATAEARAGDLATLGGALTADGDLLLYGCSVASGAGEAFIAEIAGRTGAEVAASDDSTGTTRLGGDWNLERAVGEVETDAAFTAATIDAYDHVLAGSLAQGDIALIGLNRSNNTFAFVALTDIAAGQKLYFTDRGWQNGNNGFQSLGGEGVISWSHTSTVSAGTVVSFDLNTGPVVTSSVGTATVAAGWADAFTTDAGSGFSSLAGDSLIIYQSNTAAYDGTPTVLFAYNGGNYAGVGSSGWYEANTTPTVGNQSNLPSGVTYHLHHSDTDGSGGAALVTDAAYSGITSGTKAELLAAITNAANWTTVTTTAAQTFVTSFSITGPDTNAPVLDFSTTVGQNQYTENGSAQGIDGDVTVSDAELDAKDSGAGNYDGASVTIVRNGTGNAEDVFGNKNSLGVLTEGQDFTFASTTVGHVDTNSNGTLVLTFNSNANSNVVDYVLQSITYTNTSEAPPSSVTLDWTFNDGTNDSDTVQVPVNIQAINDPPVLSTGARSLTTIAEDPATNAGTLVSDILTSNSGTATDVDSANIGVAVTGVTDTNGTWQYSTDGVDWTNISDVGVATDGALLLAHDDYIRFVPNADYNGTDTGSVTFKAWDQSSGTAGYVGDTTSGTAFSSESATATITVTAVNDAPTFGNLGGTVGYDPSGPAVVMDSNVTVNDVELGTAGTYNGSSVTISRSGIPNSNDDFSLSSVKGVTLNGSNVEYDSQTIATWSESAGTLTITFADTSRANVNRTLQSIAFANTVDAAGTMTFDWIFSDGSTVNQGAGGAKSASGSTSVVIDLAPSIANLNGDTVSWAGVGNTVTLESGGDASVSDPEFNVLNGGNGNWGGGSISAQRSGTAFSSDVFAVSDGSGYTVSGSNLISGGHVFATVNTTTAGVITITFTDANGTIPTTTLVNDVLQHITYRNDTPTGDTVIRFSLSDGSSAVTADVTVESDTIYVTNTTDTGSIDVSDGVSFSEAVAIAAADTTGTQTLVLSSAFSSSTTTLAGNIALNESLTLDADAAGSGTITGSTITIASGQTLTVTNGASDVLTIASTLAGAGDMVKTGAGDVKFTSTSNSSAWSGALTINAGRVVADGSTSVNPDTELTTGTITLDGGTLSSTLTGFSSGGGYTIDNAIVLGSSGGTIDIGGSTGKAVVTLSGLISGGGDLTKTGAAYLTLTHANTYTGTTTVSAGKLVVSNDDALGTTAGGTTVTTGGSLQLDAGITLAEALTISGDGYDTSTYFGAIHLVGGGSGSATITGAITLAADASIFVDSGDSLTISGDITEGGNSYALNKDGTVTVENAAPTGLGGTLTLSGSNSYTGKTTITKGTLAVVGGSAIADTSAVSVSGTLDLSASGSSETIGTLSGGGAGRIVLGANTLTTNHTGNTAFLGVISGTGGFAKTNSGTIELRGANIFTGALTVSGGTVSLTHSGGGTLADLAALSVASGATLRVTQDQTVSGISGSGTIAVGKSNTSITLTVGNGDADGSFSGAIINSGTNSTSNLTKIGTGTLTLSGSNSYGGSTTVSAGTLVAANADALGSTAAGTTVASGATLEIGDGVTLASEALTISGTGVSGAGVLTIGTNGTASVAGAITLADDTTIGVGKGGALTLSGALSGDYALTKIGDGALTLSGSNTYSGTTTVSAGTLVAGNANALGTTAGATTVSSGATLEIGDGVTLADEALTLSGTGVSSVGALTIGANATASVGSAIALADNSTFGAGAGGALTLSGVISGAGKSLTKTGAGTVTLSGANTFNGSVAVSAGTLAVSGGSALSNGSTVTVASGAKLALGSNETIAALEGSGTVDLDSNTLTSNFSTSATFAGVIQGTGGLTKSGSGTLELTGQSTYTGTTTVSSGILQLNNAGNQVLSDESKVSVSTGATLALLTSEAIGALTGTGTVSIGANVLTLNGGSPSTSFSGTITDGTDSGSVVKVGTGTQALKGTLTYDGGTTVSGGELQVYAGSLPGDVFVDSDGTLRFNGSGGGDYAGTITGSGTVKAYGSGTVTLSGNNSSFSGLIDVNSSATLIIANTNAVGTSGNGSSGSGITVHGGTKLRLADGVTIGDKITVSGSGATVGTVAGADAEISGRVLVQGDVSVDTDGAGSALTISGEFDGGSNANVDLTKTGAGSLTLSYANTDFSGLITVSEGTLVADNDDALGTTGNGTTVASGATLKLTSGVTLAENLTIAGTGASGAGAIAVSTTSLPIGPRLNGTLTLSDAATIDIGTDTSLTVSGVVDGNFTLTKAGDGRLRLQGDNTGWDGAIVANAGTLDVGSDTALGSVTGSTTIAGDAEMRVNNRTLNENFILNSSASGDTGAISLSAANSTATLNGDITLNGTSSAIFVETGAALTLGGTLSGSGSLTKAGDGTLTLSASETYTGATTVSAGTLVLTGGLDGTSGLTVDQGATLAGSGTVFDSNGTGNLVTINGTIAPGVAGVDDGHAYISIYGNLAFGATGVYAADIAGTSVGDQYDALDVHGTVTIDSSATLQLNYTVATPGNGDTHRLISNDSTDAITGTFSGLGEGATTTQNGTVLTAYYAATDGGDTSGGNEFMLQAPVDEAPTLTVAIPGLDLVSIYADGADGLEDLAGIASAVVSSDGAWVYVTSKADAALVVFSRDTTTGALTYSSTIKNGDGGATGLDKPDSLVLSSDGKNLYVLGSNTETDLVVFNRNTTTGALTYSTKFNLSDSSLGGLGKIRTTELVISPDGKTVYASDNRIVVVFTRNTSTGALSYSTNFAYNDDSGGDNITSMVVSSDGKNVYIGAASEIKVYNRNETTGALTYSTVFIDGVGGVDGLASVKQVVVSADGLSVYVASESDNAVAIFSRDTTTGALTYQGMVKDDVDGVDGLQQPRALAISPDGTQVYSGGYFDEALVVFGRDTTTGALTYYSTLSNGTGGVSGLSGVTGFAVSSDGTSVYALSSGGNKIELTTPNHGTTRSVALADATNGLADTDNASVLDTEGDWTGGTLTIQRVTTGGTADGNANDVFNFLSGASLSFNGSIAQGADSNGTVLDGATQFATWTYNSSAGTLVFTFATNGDATTARVQALVRSVGYSNATPYGDTTIRFTLTDTYASNAVTADVTVTSSTIYVDQTNDDGDGDAADGFSLREALARGTAQSGADTIYVTLADNSTIDLGSSVTFGDSDTLNLDGADGLVIDGSTITIEDSGSKLMTVTVASGNTATIDSAIGNVSGNFTKNGAGSLTLSGGNGFNGTLTVSAGTLTSDNNAISNSAAVTVASGATLSLAATERVGALSGAGTVDLNSYTLSVAGDDSSSTFSGVIQGTGGLTKLGTGTLELTGQNTYTGATTVSAGTLQLNEANGQALADTSAVSVTGTLALLTSEAIGALSGSGSVSLGSHVLTIDTGSGSGTFTGAITDTSSGSVVKLGAGTQILSGANSYTGGTTIAAGTLEVSTTSLSGDVINNATLEFNQSSSATYAGVISGTGNLVKSGSGTVTLTGSNTYTGTTTISAGGLTLDAAGGALADTTAVTVESSGTLTLVRSETVGSIAGAGSIGLGSGNTLTVGGNDTDTSFSGAISGDSALVKTGSGTLTLSGSNTYTGTTTLLAGALSVGADDNLGANTGTDAVILGAGTRLFLTGTAGIGKDITLTGNATIQADADETLSGVITDGTGSFKLTKTGAGTLTLSGANTYDGGTTVVAGTLKGTSASLQGDIVNNSTLEFAQSSDGTYAGVLSGSGDLVKSGSGKLTLSGDNTYTGATTISAGALVVGHANALGTSDGATTVASGAALWISEFTQAVTLTENLVLAGTGISDGGALRYNNSNNRTVTLTGTIGLAADTTIYVGTNDVIDLKGVISGDYGLTKTGNGTAGLWGDNSYTGITTISAGGLTARHANALGTTTTKTVIVSGGTLTISNGVTLDEGNLEIAGTLSLSGSAATVASAITLTDDATVNVSSSSGNLTVSGSISGAHSLTKSGNGALTLTATANTYDGGTTVTGGTLSVDGGDRLGTGLVTLDDGTTLTVTEAATIANALTVGIGTDLINGLNTGQTVTLNTQADVTWSGNIKGLSHTLVKTGGGTLTLTGTNNTSGQGISTLQVDGGAISAAEANDLGIGGVKLNGGNLALTGTATYTNGITLLQDGTITVADGVTATWQSGIFNSGGLTKDGAGTLVLTSTGSFAGGTTISSGSLSVTDGSNLGSGSITLNGGTLAVTGSDVDLAAAVEIGGGGGTISNANALTLSGAISGTGSMTKSGAGMLTLTGTSNATTWSGGLSWTEGTVSVGSDANLGTGTLEINGGTLALTGGVSVGNDLSIGSTGGMVHVYDDHATLSGAISGDGTLTKTATGSKKLILSGNNSGFTGGITVEYYYLTINDAAALGSGQLTLAGGSLESTGTTTVDNAIHLANSGNQVSTLKTANGETLTLNGTITVSDSAQKVGIAGIGGTLAMTGNTNFTGAEISLNQGSLILAATGSLGADVNVIIGDRNLTLTGTGTFVNDILLNNDLSLTNAEAVTLSGDISQEGSTRDVTKLGAGALTLTGSNSYLGLTTVSEGTLMAAGGVAIPDTSAVTVSEGATFQLGADETVASIAGAGTIALGANVLTAGGDDSSTAFSGGIGGTGGSLVKTGSGTLTLSGTNTYDGGTTVSAGMLAVGADGLGSGTVTLGDGTTLTVTEAATIANALTVGIGTDLINGLNTGQTATLETAGAVTWSGDIKGLSHTLVKTGAGTLTLTGTNNTSGQGISTLQIDAGVIKAAEANDLGIGGVKLNGGNLELTGSDSYANGITLLQDGTITVGDGVTARLTGVTSGDSALTKAGDGTLDLSGNGTHSGGTNVDAGTLIVSSTIANTSGVTVGAGATLGGTGSIGTSGTNGAVIVQSGGILAAGASPGTLTLNNGLTLAAGAIVQAEFNGATAGTQYDRIVVTAGSVSLDGAILQINLSNGFTPSIQPADAFQLIDNQGSGAIIGALVYNGTSRGEGAEFVLAAPNTDKGFTISYTGGTGNDVVLTVADVVVPTLGADTGTVGEDGPVLSGTLFGNDTDNNPNVTFTITAVNGTAAGVGTGVTGSNGGTFTLNANGTYTFDPGTAFQLLFTNSSVTTSVTYTVSDGQNTSTTTLTVTVTGANDAPVAIADAGSATEAGGLSNGTAGTNATGNVLVNDSDVDAGAVRSISAIQAIGGATGTVGGATAGSFGTLTLNADGSYTYVIDNLNPTVDALQAGQTLTDAFTYTVADGLGGTATAVLTITINGAADTAPVAQTPAPAPNTPVPNGNSQTGNNGGPQTTGPATNTPGLNGNPQTGNNGGPQIIGPALNTPVLNGNAQIGNNGGQQATGPTIPAGMIISPALQTLGATGDNGGGPGGPTGGTGTTPTITFTPTPTPTPTPPSTPAAAGPGTGAPAADGGNTGAGPGGTPAGTGGTQGTGTPAAGNTGGTPAGTPGTPAAPSAGGTPGTTGTTGIVVTGSGVGTGPGATGGAALFAAQPIPNVQAAPGQAFSFQVPAGSFQHTDANASTSIQVDQANGDALPSWLQFDPTSGSFSGEPPAGFEGVIEVRVTVTDTEGRSAQQVFEVDLGGPQQEGALDTGTRFAAAGTGPAETAEAAVAGEAVSRLTLVTVADGAGADATPAGAGERAEGAEPPPAGKPSLTAQLKTGGSQGLAAEVAALMESLLDWADMDKAA